MATYTTKNYEDIVNSIIKYVLENNEELSDLNVGSIARTLIEAVGLELNSTTFNGIYQQVQNVYESTRISTATANDLDELAKLVGVLRKQGVKSTCQISLIRNNPAQADFTIPNGSIFSTQPISGEEPLRFISTVQNTFFSSINSESNEFINGVYNYDLSERFISSVSNINASISNVSTTLVEGVDYELVKLYVGNIIDTDTIEELELFDSTSGWVYSTDAEAVELDLVTYKEGTSSFKVGKSGITQNYFSYENVNSSSKDLTNKLVYFNIYMEDTLTIQKLSYLKVLLGENESNCLQFSIDASTLQVGWNELYLNPNIATLIGSPILTNIIFKKFIFEMLDSNTVIANENILLDYMILTEVRDYKGDMIKFLHGNIDDNSNFLINYIPLSKEVIVEAESIGSSYNAAKDKIVYKISNLPNITVVNNHEVGTNGEDVETDTELRDRVTTASFAIGKATTNAIKEGLLGLDFISSVNIEDMPLTYISDESFIYTTSEDEYSLINEVAQNDSVLRLLGGNTTLSSDFDIGDSTISLTSGSSFQNSGYCLIGTELISYTSKSTNTLSGVTRGLIGTVEQNHTSGTAIDVWFYPTVDYVITNESKVKFISASLPVDLEECNVKYNYRRLGYFEIYLVGPSSFTAQQQLDIDNKVIEYKSAGIYYNWTTPQYVNTNVTANVNLKEGYSFVTLQPLIEAAVRNKLNLYEIGTTLYLSQIIETIMQVEGVNYTTVLSPSIDISVSANEMIKSGTIIINLI